jgi:hypothetical protein
MEGIKPDKSLKPEQFTQENWLWIYTNRCEAHGHRYSSHLNCFYGEEQYPEKVVGLDIEASGLNADFGLMLCVDPDTLILTGDLEWKKAKELSVNDELIGTNEFPVLHKKGEKRQLLYTKITGVENHVQQKIKVNTSMGETICSEGHSFLVYSPHSGGYVWKMAKDLKTGDKIRFLSSPWKTNNSRDAGWMAGFVDGEGCVTCPSDKNRKRGNCYFAVTQGVKQGLPKYVDTLFKDLGFSPFRTVRLSKKETHQDQVIWRLFGRELFRFLGEIRPTRLMDRFRDVVEKGYVGLYRGLSDGDSTYATVESIIYLGSGEVITIETDQHTLITDGFVSHNCFCMKPIGGEIIYDCLTLKDIDSGIQDKRLVESCVDKLVKFDRVFGHYSSRFDIPFLRTRALVHKLYFPGYGAMKQSDTWQMARKKLKIHSNRQDSVAQTLTQKSDKTRIHPDIWLKAQFGNKKDRKEALDYILEHCKIDVMELEENYLSLLPYVKPSSTSI